MKIKTKYNIGDYVIVEIDCGLIRGKVEKIDIEVPDRQNRILYSLLIIKGSEVIRQLLREELILCKATKRNIRKWESKRNDNTRKTKRVD